MTDQRANEVLYVRSWGQCDWFFAVRTQGFGIDRIADIDAELAATNLKTDLAQHDHLKAPQAHRLREPLQGYASWVFRAEKSRNLTEFIGRGCPYRQEGLQHPQA